MPYQTYADRWGRRLAVVVLAAAASGAVAAPATGASAREDLAVLRSRVGELTAALRSTLRDRSEEEAELERLELALGRTARELRTLDARRQAVEHRRRGLSREHAALDRRLAEQRRRVAVLARAAVAVGGERGLAALLAGNDRAASGRVVAYLGYLQTTTNAELRALARSQRELGRVAGELAEQARTIAVLITDTERARAALDRRRRSRARVLVRLNLRIQNKRQILGRLNRDAARLSALVKGLEALRDSPSPVAARPVETVVKAAFSERRGHLAWPAAGRVRHRFGAARRPGNLTWRGIWLDAPAGTAVRAVSRGRIAFADWFRGFGLMLIIDHGDGYMSLYGHNESLLKDTGEWVDSGQVVATVGDTGGLARAGLYFEVRHDGVPEDPMSWLARHLDPLVRR